MLNAEQDGDDAIIHYPGIGTRRIVGCDARRLLRTAYAGNGNNRYSDEEMAAFGFKRVRDERDEN